MSRALFQALSKRATRRALVVLALCAAASACVDTGGERLALPLRVQGTEREELALEGARFTLTRAQVAFGPVYFCAAEQADAESCEVALAELTEAVVFDALLPEALAVATLDATTGHIHSAMYDYGISWTLTRQAPRALAGVEHSLLLAGEVERDGASLRFSARVDVEPGSRGALALHAQPTDHVLGAGDVLTVSVDPYAWLRAIDLDALFALDVEGSGEITIAPGSQAYEALLQGMQNRAPVRFDWE